MLSSYNIENCTHKTAHAFLKIQRAVADALMFARGVVLQRIQTHMCGTCDHGTFAANLGFETGSESC